MNDAEMYAVLRAELASKLSGGEAVTVAHATMEDLSGFIVERWKCHENVRRWCLQHSGHRRAMGWIVTGGFVLDRHSVVDRGAEGLLDITPLPDRETTIFLPEEGGAEAFDALPNQILVMDEQFSVLAELPHVS